MKGMIFIAPPPSWLCVCVFKCCVLAGFGSGVFEVARARAKERMKEIQNITRESTVPRFISCKPELRT